MTTEIVAQTNDPFTFEAPADHYDSSGMQYPSAFWMNGDQKLASRKSEAGNPQAVGGFFGKAENFQYPPTAPWQYSDEVAFSNGSVESGYLVTSLPVAIILTRKEWRIIEDGKVTMSQPDYFEVDGRKAKQRLQLLCASPSVVNGAGEMYPFVLTFNGMSCSAVDNYQDSVLARLDKNVVGTLKRLAAKEMPRYCFWVEITGKRTPDGKPLFEMVGKEGAQSAIVKPDAPAIIKPLDIDGLKACYVGTEHAETFATWREMAIAAGWKQQRVPQAQHEALPAPQHQQAQLPAPARRNGGVQRATEKQLRFIRQLAAQKEVDEGLEEYCQANYGCTLEEISTVQASEIIDNLKQIPAPRATVAPVDDDTF
jgi:hypothetical protein